MSKPTARYSVVNVTSRTAPGQTKAGLSVSAPPASADSEPVSVSATAPQTPHAYVVAGGFITVVAVAVLSWWLVPGAPEFPIRPDAPLAGLTIFAVFFVGAQALERLLEALSMYWGVSEKKAAEEKANDADTAAADPNIEVSIMYFLSTVGISMFRMSCLRSWPPV